MARLYLGSNKISECYKAAAYGDTLNVTPSNIMQTVTYSGEKDGYTEINIPAVTNTIDSNISSNNIKKDVTILGVTGGIETTEKIGLPREVSLQGKLGDAYDFTLPSSVTDIDFRVMEYAFYNCTGLTSASFPHLEAVSGDYALYYAFYNCTGLTSASFPHLEAVSGNYALYYAFYNCRNLTSIDLSSLTTASGNYSMHSAFYNCRNLTSVDLSNLTTLGDRSMNSAFASCLSLTSVDLSSLTTINGNYSMQLAFESCINLTTLSFPALTSTSFSSSFNDSFYRMLYGVTGCTVHFPSNLQSIMGSWSDVTAGFAGTNTTVLFDLPATT